MRLNCIYSSFNNQCNLAPLNGSAILIGSPNFIIILIKNISNNDIKKLDENCYSYQSKNDLENIVKYIAIENYGTNEVINQRYFKIIQSSTSKSIIIIEGSPNNLPAYFSKTWINPIVIELKKDNEHQCLQFIEIYKYRD